MTSQQSLPGPGGGNGTPALAVDALSVAFDTRHGVLDVTENVTFNVHRGQTLALVGESGSGKSVTSLAIMGLLPPRSSRVTGSVRLAGEEIVGASQQRLQDLRGAEIAMIFQEPMTSLNPVYTIGNQMVEVIRRHTGGSRSAARRRAAEMLGMVGIPTPDRRLDAYPHEFSGGMRQRAMIATALACEPQVLMADEPTTALDVTIQAQILDLIKALAADLDLATIWVTHDMGVVADIADEVAVMYAGQIVEKSSVGDLFSQPRHPYTSALLQSMPYFSRGGDNATSIPGAPPRPGAFPTGCRFAPRCEHARAACGQGPVPMDWRADRGSRCVRQDELYPLLKVSS